MLSLKKLISATIYFIFCMIIIYAESFRVHQTHTLIVPQLNETSEENIINAEINDAFLIELPKDTTYLNGIELQIKVPQIITEWPNSVVYVLYSNLNPMPSESVIDYTGERVYTNVIPPRLTWVIQIPVNTNSKITETPYAAAIPMVPEVINNKMFIRLQLAMKGVPKKFEKSTLQITAQPMLIDKGMLNLQLTAANGKKLNPYTLFIDGEAVKHDENGILLKTGIHSISLVSDFYRNEVRSITIDQAKTTTLPIEFRDITPEVRITAPETAVIYLDGNMLESVNTVIQVPQGDHTFRFVVGDYEVIKTVKTEKGRSYNVSLGIDAKITENIDEESTSKANVQNTAQ